MPETATVGSRFLRSPASPGTHQAPGAAASPRQVLPLARDGRARRGGSARGGAWLYINESVAEVRAHSQPLIDAQQDLDVPTPDQPTVALVIGYDKRLGPESSIGSRSDTIMLLRADPRRRSLSTMSIPRDLIVPHPVRAGQ